MRKLRKNNEKLPSIPQKEPDKVAFFYPKISCKLNRFMYNFNQHLSRTSAGARRFPINHLRKVGKNEKATTAVR